MRKDAGRPNPTLILSSPRRMRREWMRKDAGRPNPALIPSRPEGPYRGTGRG